ncbi:hypothetical protein AB0G04_43790 [Actinoplanes sp. NPDC023801]|uniref:hypothetical protein n=1 Tax=Actinoplanes sp. NPDC023801 TaxID=3154595 RepID=UPI0033CBE0EE
MTSNVVSPGKKTEGDRRQLSPEQAVAAAMVAEAKARGLELTGPNGLLKLFTTTGGLRERGDISRASRRH